MGIYCSERTGSEETGFIYCTLMTHTGDHYNEVKDVHF